MTIKDEVKNEDIQLWGKMENYDFLELLLRHVSRQMQTKFHQKRTNIEVD